MIFLCTKSRTDGGKHRHSRFICAAISHSRDCGIGRQRAAPFPLPASAAAAIADSTYAPTDNAVASGGNTASGVASLLGRSFQSLVAEKMSQYNVLLYCDIFPATRLNCCLLAFPPSRPPFISSFFPPSAPPPSAPPPPSIAIGPLSVVSGEAPLFRILPG